MSKAEKMEHIMAVSYALKWSETLSEDKVAVFDDRQISQEDVLRHVNEGETYDARIVYMTEKQFQNLFRKND